MVNKILCSMGWHTSKDGYEKNPYQDGVLRPHAWCKYCGKHMPLFAIRKLKNIFGEKRQKTFIKNIKGKLQRYN